MDLKIIVEDKISLLERAELKTKEDYEKCANLINDLQHDVSNYYDEKKENQHDYLQCKIYYLLLTLENIVKSLRLYSILLYNYNFKIKDKFNLHRYTIIINNDFVTTSSIVSMCVKMFRDTSYENVPEHIKILLLKIDQFLEKINTLFSNFIVVFHSHPIDQNMALRISKDVLYSTCFTTLFDL